jgi:hypothetical protein
VLQLTEVATLCRLTLNVTTPLSSYTDGYTPFARFTPDLELGDGVWELQTIHQRRLWLEVMAREVRGVSRAQAFVALGAVDVLNALGLEDAAIALRSGDYELACVQWINGRA